MATNDTNPAAAPANTSPRYTWVYVMLFLLSAVLFSLGVVLAMQKNEWVVLSAGTVSMVIVLALLPLALASQARIDRLERLLADRIAPLEQSLSRSANTLSLIAEQQLVSDRAKSIAFRQKDADAFRRAIQEDVSKAEYDAALSLIERMDSEFGYKQEADRLRGEVMEKRDEAIRRQVEAAVVVVDRHVQAEQWQLALKEAQRLRTLFPTQTRVLNLPNEIEQRRNGVKRDLLTRWQEQVRAGHIDEAFVVLKKLDLYLTPVEAASLEEDARNVIRDRQGRLRTAFTNAIHNGQTAEAIRIGEEIVDDFPNSQMAKEIRDRMDTLRTRLRQEQEAGAGINSVVPTAV
jgi:hypothetical protein